MVGDGCSSAVSLLPCTLAVDTTLELVGVGVVTMSFGIVVVHPWYRLPLVVVGWRRLLASPNVAGTRCPVHVPV